MLKLNMNKLLESIGNVGNRIEEVSSNDVAIIGICANLPGADNMYEFWNNLRNGVASVGKFPDARVPDVENYLKFLGKFEPGIQYESGAYLDAIDGFDYAFFRLSPKEAGLMDPNQRMFLQAAWGAVEDAGYGGEKMKRSRTGVYLGYCEALHNYRSFVYEIDSSSVSISLPGNLASMIASRISYLMDLRGPAIAVDTACSSSLVALHLAFHAMRNGECDMAIVGGVRLNLLPVVREHKFGVESSDGRTKTFDENSDGTGQGEGVAAMLLKPLAKAVKDRDNIYAVIKGSATNQDGSSIGITAPNVEAQEEVVVNAWKDAGIDPETISYIEAHGTGTKLGDPIEIDGLQRAFRRFTDKKQFCAVGSVKTNLGHLDNAAGIAGLLKAVLALRNGEIPPSLHFESPNRKIDFTMSPVYVNDKLKKWESSEFPRRCGVSSFGLSGTNCHVVLEEFCDHETAHEEQDGMEVLTISAANIEALKNLLDTYRHFMEQDGGAQNFRDICYTANTGRFHYRCRLAVIAENAEDLKEKINILSARGLSQMEEKWFFIGGYEAAVSGRTMTLKGRTMADAVEVCGGADEKVKAFAAGGKKDIRLLSDICQLYVDGSDFNWDECYRHEKRKKVSLPIYPFEKKRCWLNIPQLRPGERSSRLKLAEAEQMPASRALEEKRESIEDVKLTGREDGFYTGTERLVAAIWRDMLGYEAFSIYDNFYDMGGDSLFLMNLINAINKQMDLDIKMSDLFQYQTVEGIAAYLDKVLGERRESGLYIPAAGSKTGEDMAAQGDVQTEEDMQDGEKWDTVPASVVPHKARLTGAASRKALKINIQSEITTYLCHSLPLCVVLSDERLYPWYYEHFVNIFSMPQEEGGMMLEYLETRAPYKDVMHEVYMGYGLLKDVHDIVDFVRDKIDMNYYVIIHLDEYYLPQKSSYQNEHFVHHSIVYGYDDEKRELMAVGFNRDQIFTGISFDYYSFTQAYENGKLYYRESAPWAENNAIELLKIREFKKEYPFSIHRFMTKLKSYLESRGDDSIIFSLRLDVQLLEKEDVKYGFDVYSVIDHCINDFIVHNRIGIDYRAFHFLYEHKRGIYQSLNFIASRYELGEEFSAMLEEYSEVVIGFGDIRIAFLKLMTSRMKAGAEMEEEKSFVSELLVMINSVIAREKQLTPKIYDWLGICFGLKGRWA